MARHIVDPTSMHRYTDETERVARAALEYSRDRLRLHPVPLDGPRTAAELEAQAGATITEDGLGGEAAMRLFADVLAPAIISIDNPRFLAFIPAAPTELSMMFDLVVGASSIYAGTWMEASGAVYAENQALAWLAGLAGLPESAAGCFVQGGTIGNLSALVAARHAHRASRGDGGARLRVACTDETHSSVATAAAVMDVDLVRVAADAGGRMTGEALAAALAREGMSGSSPSPRPPGRPTPGRSTTWPGSRTCAGSTASGCTSTGPTAAPPSRPPPCATSSPASSTPTRSSSTRTSGSSRRSTPAPCSTETPSWPGPPTPSRRATSSTCRGAS